MCVYESCPYECITKFEHHSRYAKMRRKHKVPAIHVKSPKVNWNIVDELQLRTTIIRKK